MAHLRATLGMDWAAPPPEVAALLPSSSSSTAHDRVDRHLAYCRRFDWPQHAGDPDRNARYAATIPMVRTSAATAMALDWSLLCRFQALLLGTASESYRRGPAYALNGQQKYGMFSGQDRLVAAKIESDAADGAHPLLKAVRLWLDMIYVHPFRDGNGRAARLAVDFLCTRHCIALPDLAILAATKPEAGDGQDYWRFALQALISTVTWRDDASLTVTP